MVSAICENRNTSIMNIDLVNVMERDEVDILEKKYSLWSRRVRKSKQEYQNNFDTLGM